MKRDRGDNPIRQLYEAATQAVDSSNAAQLRNKLTSRDISHLRIYGKKLYMRGEKVTVSKLTEEANHTREGDNQVSRSTVWRHMPEMQLEAGPIKGDFPRQIQRKDLSQWLASRRTFCKQWKGKDKSELIMVDESFFGLKNKQRRYKKEIHPTGAQRCFQYEPAYAKDRVTVFAGIGINVSTDIYIFEHGKYLNAAEYGHMLSTDVLPKLSQACRHPVFVEDNCSIHSALDLQQMWEEVQGIEHVFLGAYWKDLNWQEKAWANLKQLVYANDREYSNKADLMQAIRQAWTKLRCDGDYRRRLVVAWENTCKKVLKANGYLVHWD